jgi:hypothetical protein
MDYFRSYSLPAGAGVVAAWDAEVAGAAAIPPLGAMLRERGAEIFPEFVRRYHEIRAPPRSRRRALQRKLARSPGRIALPPARRRKLAYSIAGAALLLALAEAPAAQAGSIFVTTKIADVDEINPTCSLGDAIRSADSASDYGGCTGATVSPNTIYLPSGGVTMTRYFTNVYGSYTGMPTIQSDITIVGNNTKIARKSSKFFRLFAVASGGKLTLDGVALSGGVASGDGVNVNADGGAAFVYLNASLTLHNSTISGNVASAGGAILNDGVTVINASVLSKNTADRGGAVFNNANNVAINNGSVLTGNKAHYGGAIYGDFGSTTVIDNSTLAKNSANRGGAVFNPLGIVRFFNNSIVTGNKAVADGGGINNSGGLLQVDETTISKNSAGSRGGGVFGPGYTFVLTNSTVTGNKAGTSGGGIYLTGTAKFSSSSNYVAKNKAPSGPDYAP